MHHPSQPDFQPKDRLPRLTPEIVGEIADSMGPTPEQKQRIRDRVVTFIDEDLRAEARAEAKLHEEDERNQR